MSVSTVVAMNASGGGGHLRCEYAVDRIAGEHARIASNDKWLTARLTVTNTMVSLMTTSSTHYVAVRDMSRVASRAPNWWGIEPRSKTVSR